jgi:hypothetical protein
MEFPKSEFLSMVIQGLLLNQKQTQDTLNFIGRACQEGAFQKQYPPHSMCATNSNLFSIELEQPDYHCLFEYLLHLLQGDKGASSDNSGFIIQ